MNDKPRQVSVRLIDTYATEASSLLLLLSDRPHERDCAHDGTLDRHEPDLGFAVAVAFVKRDDRLRQSVETIDNCIDRP